MDATPAIIKGRILFASMLWHKLMVVDPPMLLIEEIQKLLVDFVWSGQHWLRAAALYLSVQEGGQGLIYIRARVATFLMQAV